MAQAARSLPPAGAAHPVPRLALVPPPRRPLPTRRILWRRRLLALVALAAVVAAGAGWLELSRPSGAGGDTASIASLLRQSERDPASLCGHLSPAMLAASGGRASCVASSPARGP